MRTKLKFIKKVLYKTKRSYGLPIDYFQLQTHTLDVTGGVKVDTYQVFSVSRALVLKAKEFRSFVYDLAYISANKDFTEGAYFDPEDRKIVVDTKDFPVGFTPKVDDYIIFQNLKYEVKEIDSFEDNAAFSFLGRKVKGARVFQQKGMSSTLNLTQSVSAIVEDKFTQSVESVLGLSQQLVEVP